LGTNWVCAQAGGAISRMASISFFIVFSRGTEAFAATLNRIGPGSREHSGTAGCRIFSRYFPLIKKFARRNVMGDGVIARTPIII
jgi:hypothetical protein